MSNDSKDNDRPCDRAPAGNGLPMRGVPVTVIHWSDWSGQPDVHLACDAEEIQRGDDR